MLGYAEMRLYIKQDTKNYIFLNVNKFFNRDPQINQIVGLY
jgi:hypothetical protein